MKKLFLFLSTALFLIGSNVMAADVVDLEIGKASAFGFQQDAYQFGPGMHNGDKLKDNGAKITLEGAEANGYSNAKGLNLNTIENYNPLGRKSFLYVHDSPDDGNFVTGGNYFIDANDTTEYIYLWAQMHGLEGTSFDYNSNMSDFNLPIIEVTVTDVDGKTIKHETFLRGTISGKANVMNLIDTLAHFDADADWDDFEARIKKEGSIPTILYRVAIGTHTEVTYSWKVTYPADHENANLVRTWTTKIKKNANLKKIATLKGLYLFNAGAGEEPNRKEEDDFKEKNLLKNFNKDVFDYNVTGIGTDGTRLYFEATMPGSTFKVTYKGDTFPGVAGGATLTYFDVPKPGGPVEIIVTATNGETRKTYTVNIVPKEEVKPLSPISLGIYVNGDGELTSTTTAAADSLLYLSQYDSAVVNVKGIPFFAEIIPDNDQDTIITHSATGNVALYYMHSLKGGEGDTLAFRDIERNLLHIKWSGNAITIAPAGPAPGEEPDLIFKTFALTNGVDTFPITTFNPIFKGDGEVKYDVSVPNKNDASLQPVYTLYDEAAFKSKKYAFARKTTIKTAGDVELELTLKEPKTGVNDATLANIDDATKWDTVKVKSNSLVKGEISGKVDSAAKVPVKYVLTLKDNKAGFKFLTLFYDSLKTPVVLDKPVSDTVDLYKAVGYVPAKIKKIFAVVESHGEVTLKGDGLGDHENAVPYPANNDYKVYEFKSLGAWNAGVSRDLIIEDKAEAGNSKQVTITLQKEYDLKLKELSIIQSGKILFSRTEKALKDSTDFDELLDSDFELGSLMDVDTKHDLAIESKVVGVKRSLRLEGDVFAFTFTVYDPDGNTRDYHVNLSYRTSNANLDYLTTSVGLVSPSFSPDFTAYELVVADSVRSLRVLAGAQDPHAVVKLETASSRNVGVTFDLLYKTTVVAIQVVAPNGLTRDYTLTIVNESLPAGTGIKAVTLDQVTIAARAGALSITSPVAERVYIYSVTGNVISSVDKTAGSVVVPVSAKGVTVIKGTSGWVSKVYLK